MEYFLSAASSNMLYHLRQNASGYYSEISLQKNALKQEISLQLVFRNASFKLH